MKTKRALIVIAGGALLAMPAWASGRNQADQLPIQSASQSVAQARGGVSAAEAEAAQQNRRQVEHLLDELEAGKNVEPAEVERVLRQSLQNE